MKRLRRISRTLPGQRLFVRSVYAQTLLEDFFVAAVASVLVIRLYLRATSYPAVVAGDLHIAHVLWGGLLMLASLLIMLAFLNRYAKQFAAVVGGIGFGAFIDELGKFITRDSNYFFEPAIAIIYILFVLLFFMVRHLSRPPRLTTEECFANAYEIAKQASITGLDQEEQELARSLLARCSQTGGVEYLETVLLGTPATQRRSLITRTREAIDRFYEYVARQWWFTGILVGAFALTATTSLYGLMAIVQWSLALALWVGGGAVILAALFWSHQRRDSGTLNVLVPATIVVLSILLTWAILVNIKQQPFSLIDLAQFIFPSLSGALIVIGVLLIPRSRLRAYRMFRRATLITIFFTQVLAFYEQQLFALVGLVLNIVLLLALRYIITHEELRLEESPAAGPV